MKVKTGCTDAIAYQELSGRKVISQFNGGQITTDAGGLLLREIEQARGFMKEFSKCFSDYRDQEAIEHTVEELLSQRIYGIAVGYEDLNDHDQLRIDSLLAVLCKKKDPTGQDRRSKNEKGKALAGKSTLNRLELTPAEAGKESRYKKIVYQGEKIERFFVDAFLRSHQEKPERIVLDLDATDDPIHGSQEVTRVFEAVLDGAHRITGSRNKDVRNQLFGDNTRSPEEKKKAGSKITRIIRKLRAHRLISKIPRSTRYKVTEKGYRILGASLRMKKKSLPATMKNVA